MGITYEEIVNDVNKEKERLKTLQGVEYTIEKPYKHPKIKVQYIVDGFDGDQFVTTAWENVLGRTPKEGEIDSFLKRLEAGEIDKEQLILELRKSPEGRGRKAFLVGLKRFDAELLYMNFKACIKACLVDIITWLRLYFR